MFCLHPKEDVKWLVADELWFFCFIFIGISGDFFVAKIDLWIDPALESGDPIFKSRSSFRKAEFQFAKADVHERNRIRPSKGESEFCKSKF